MTGGWPEYFDRLSHQSPLYRAQAAIYVESLGAAVGLSRAARVLDFGCGFGFVAGLLAPRVGEVWWWDPSPNVRAVAERTLASFSNARYCDLSGTASAGLQRGEWQEPMFDWILVNSVAQYMRPDEFRAWLSRWGGMLAPGGGLVLSDLIPTRHHGLSDIADLLRLGVRYGSPLRAASDALGGVRHYWRTSRAVPLTPIDLDTLEQHAGDAGLEVTRLPDNLTHFRKRWTAVVRPRPRTASVFSSAGLSPRPT